MNKEKINNNHNLVNNLTNTASAMVSKSDMYNLDFNNKDI